jgi:NADH:ubiquinone oxidoreductase subunit B-like Fe-S oxidoreductase
VIYPWIEVSGCCQLVLDSLKDSVSSWEQIGISYQPNKPEEANLLIVGGWINQAQARHLKDIYSRMAGDKLVLAVGSCSISASVFEDLEDVQKLSDVLPVHYNVTGCPPRWDVVLKGIDRLAGRGQADKTVKDILNETGSENVF